MTGAEYANLVAWYVARRFESRGLKAYREVRVGKTIIAKNRCIDILCVGDNGLKAFAIECKFQDSQGTVDEKIPYALDDLQALPMTGCIAYAGTGFSAGVLHMLAASPHAAFCQPLAGQIESSNDTRELDHLLATLACHSVKRAGDVMTPVEVEALLASLDAVDLRGHCPHGRPVLVRLTLSEVERRFGRV